MKNANKIWTWIGIVLASLAAGMGMTLIIYWVSFIDASRHPYIHAVGRFVPEECRRLCELSENYAKEHGGFPESIADLMPVANRFFSGGTTDKDVLDPWHRPYLYHTIPDGFEITSLGRDGVPGGVGLDIDRTTRYINGHCEEVSSKPEDYWLTYEQFTSQLSGKRILDRCIMTGVFTFCVCMITATRKNKAFALLGLFFTLVATLLTASTLVILYEITSSNH